MRNQFKETLQEHLPDQYARLMRRAPHLSQRELAPSAAADRLRHAESSAHSSGNPREVFASISDILRQANKDARDQRADSRRAKRDTPDS